jgi:hypothetical protein
MTHTPFPIFDKLGGLDAAIELLRDKAPRPSWPSFHTLVSWKRFRRLPPRVELLLRDAASARGIRYRREDYLFREPPPRKPAAKRTAKARRKHA